MKKPRSPEMEKAAVAWKLVEKLDEQRRYPRLALDIPVAFRNASGQHCAAKLVNVGPGGIQIRCNTATAQILHPNGGKISPDNSSIVQIAIAIPLIYRGGYFVGRRKPYLFNHSSRRPEMRNGYQLPRLAPESAAHC